jgi:hypothetical protein
VWWQGHYYVEVVKPQLLVYDHVSRPRDRFCATFIAEGEKTRVTVRMLFPSTALRDKTAKEFNGIEGLSQTLERLANYVSASADRYKLISPKQTHQNQHETQPLPPLQRQLRRSP